MTKEDMSLVELHKKEYRNDAFEAHWENLVHDCTDKEDGKAVAWLFWKLGMDELLGEPIPTPSTEKSDE